MAAVGAVPRDRVERIAARGVCHAGCTHIRCDAARLAREVLWHRDQVID